MPAYPLASHLVWNWATWQSGSSLDLPLNFAALTLGFANGYGGNTEIGGGFTGLLGFILICVVCLMLRGSNYNLHLDCNAKNVAKATSSETTLTACDTCLPLGCT